MTSLHTFSDINKDYEDIMVQDFRLRKYISLAYQFPVQDNLNIRAKFYQRPRAGASLSSNQGSCSFQYLNPLYQINTTLKTSGHIKTDVHTDLGRFARSLQGNLKVHTDSSLKHINGKIKLYWPQDMYKIKSVLGFGERHRWTVKYLCTLLRKPQTELGAGLGLSLDFGERQLYLCRPSMWYYWDSNKLLVTYKENQNRRLGGSLEAQMYNKLNPKTDVAIGAAYNFHKKNNNISFGFRHKHSSKFTIKTRVDSNLDLRAAFDLQITNNIHLVITSTYDLLEQHGRSDHKPTLAGIRAPFSLKVNFGDLSTPVESKMP